MTKVCRLFADGEFGGVKARLYNIVNKEMQKCLSIWPITFFTKTRYNNLTKKRGQHRLTLIFEEETKYGKCISEAHL